MACESLRSTIDTSRAARNSVATPASASTVQGEATVHHVLKVLADPALVDATLDAATIGQSLGSQEAFGTVEADIPMALDMELQLKQWEEERRTKAHQEIVAKLEQSKGDYLERVLARKRVRENEFLLIKEAIQAYRLEQQRRASEPFYKKWARKLPWKDDEPKLYDQLRVLSHEFSKDEIIAILNNQDLLEKKEDLLEAFIVGGKELVNERGEKARLYTLGHFAAGGLGAVKDAYILKEGKVQSAVVKIPHQSDTAAKQAIFNYVHKLEAYNAKSFIGVPLPHVMQSLFVSQPDTKDGLATIVYEKVGAEISPVPQSLENFAVDTAIPFSTKIRAFSYALDATEALHKRGFAHLDIKPDNIVLDNDQKGTLIDFGSMVKLSDEVFITLKPAAGRSYGQIRRAVDIGEGIKEYGIAFSAFFTDLDVLESARKNLGRNIAVADRHALGGTIFRVLELANMVILKDHPNFIIEPWKYPGLKEFPQNHDYLATSPLRPYFKGGEAPASLKKLIALANELLDITNPTRAQRPLGQIAQEVRECAQQCEQDLDILCKKP